MRAWSIVLALGAVGCDVLPGKEDRVEQILALEGDPEQGQEVYATSCVECHRESGLGEADPDDPGIGESLQEALGEGDEELVEVVLHGKEEMPAFEDVLTDQQIADVLAYVHEGLFP